MPPEEDATAVVVAVPSAVVQQPPGQQPIGQPSSEEELDIILDGDKNNVPSSSLLPSSSYSSSSSPNNGDDGNIIIVEGPDLNISRSPFDKKNYRQILLPNGLRAVLVSDVVAMTQVYNNGGLYVDDDDHHDHDHEEEEDNDDDKNAKKNADKIDVPPSEMTEHDKLCRGNSYAGDSDDDDDDDDESEEEARGIRDAAAAMIVGVGSLYDPPECQGMAHFLEHLLFMGSAKYPTENAYDAFMTKHGGNDNAYTEMEHTVYHFDIPQEHLPKALDIFAQFFVHPLMLESSVDRELNAVESEFQLVKNSDNARVQQLMCHTAGRTPEEHPSVKFGWGNYKSLKEIPEKMNVQPLKLLRDFYDKYYYASNMRLVVVGGYSLDDLQKHVIESFSDIRSKDDPGSYTWEQAYDSPMKGYGLPFAPSSLQKIFYIVPVKERHSISVTWQIPSQVANWRAKPCDHLSHLIGHEGTGSLLASLKAKSWVTACCAGVGDDGDENASTHALFVASFSLSEEGVTHWKEVVSELYRYVGMLRYYCSTEEGLPLWIFEELKAVYDVSHRYADEQSPEDFAVDLAEEMSPSWNVPPDRLLDASGLLFEYDPHTIKTLLSDYFIPQNARIDMTSAVFGRSGDYEDVEAASKVQYFDYFNLSENCLPPSDTLLDPKKVGPPHIEPIFGTPFWCQQLPQSVIQEWTDFVQPQLPPEGSSLSLPQKNEFIPTDFSLKPLPRSDCDHPLLHCSVKLQIPVGKRREWFPATVTQYNGIKNEILCVYEDHDEKWHKVDDRSSDLTHIRLTSPDFEGTLDGKKIKYKIVSLPMEGKKAVLRYGDDTDFHVEDGKAFPPIPPAAPPSRLPTLVSNTNELKLWHLQDRVFKRPIADLRLQLNCADANKSPLHSACADILANLVLDSVTEISYMASVCDLNSAISSNDSGFSVRADGFDDKLLKLFMVVLESLLKFRTKNVNGALPDGFTKQRFDLVLESYRRSCMNSGLRARSLSSDIRIQCLRPGFYSDYQKAKAIEDIDIPTFTTIISNILHRIGAEGLYHGNVDVTDAEDARDRILALLRTSGGGSSGGLVRKKYPQQPVLKLMPNKPCDVTCVVKDPQEPNTSVEIYFQVGKDNVRDRVMVDLLIEMMDEPLYNQIRTLDQFGYDVSCDSRWTHGVIGMHLCVVAPSKTVQETEDRIERFLVEFRQSLVDMSQDEFMEHMVGLAKYKLNVFHSLSEETDQLWDEIRDGRYLWEAEREEVMCLKTLTKKAAIEAYDKWLFPQSKQRMRLAVKVVASEGPASIGRPDVNPEDSDEYNDRRVQACHNFFKNQTFGRIF